MSREEHLLLADLQGFCERVIAYTQALDQSTFANDQQSVDAVLHNIMLIGEVCRLLSDTTKQRMPEVPWDDVRRTRNIVTHVYFGVDLDIIWDIVTNHIPIMLKAVHRERMAGES